MNEYTNETMWDLPYDANMVDSTGVQCSRWRENYSTEHGCVYFENVDTYEVAYVLPENATVVNSYDGHFAVENPIINS